MLGRGPNMIKMFLETFFRASFIWHCYDKYGILPVEAAVLVAVTGVVFVAVVAAVVVVDTGAVVVLVVGTAAAPETYLYEL